MATTGDVCSINAYHTGNIFKFKTCLELKKEIEPVIPYEEKLDLFHIHLLHFFNKGFETIGGHNVHWNGRDENGFLVPGGVYLYEISTGDQKNVNSIHLLQARNSQSFRWLYQPS